MFRACILLVILLFGLGACVPTGTTPSSQPAAAHHYTAKEVASLRDRLRQLPGAQVLSGEPLRLRYRGEELFANGAVLPLPGGSRLLDPLSKLLSESGWRWQGVVRAATDNGEAYDKQLAAGRLEMLQRYFAKRGVKTDNVSWQTRAEKGPSLQLTLEMDQPSAASSSGVKQ